MADEDQTEALFRDHHERLSRFARRLVGTADADDLVQETFLRAHRYLCGGQDISAPLSFLFVTMRNLVNDANRHKKLAFVETSLDADEILPDENEPSVERRAMSERDFENLCTAISQLPERMRHAFVLRKVYGYSCREIAERLGRSTNTVRDQVAQSFKRLHALQHCDGASDVKGQHRTGDKPSLRAKDNEQPRPFGLTSLASRESSR